MYVCNKKSNLLVVGALIVLWAITILSLFFKSFYLNVWIGIIIVVLSIILTSKKYGIFSIPTLFIALSYLFHCFQFCLYVLKIEYNVAFNIIEVLGFEIATKIVRFFNIAICSLTTGFISVKNRKINTNCKYYNDETIRLYGRVFCILFFLPRIYIDILNVIYFFKFGYESTFQVTSVGILSTLGYGFYLGVILLIVGNRNNKINAKKILIVFSVYLIISMFSGRRTNSNSFDVLFCIL